MFDHGINNDKHNLLDASLRVPLIMRGAGLPAGETREFATTLDITELKIDNDTNIVKNNEDYTFTGAVCHPALSC